MFTSSRLEHDEAVRRCAADLIANGYDVRARIEGWFEAPDYINGYRPDIVAKMGDHFIIVEVKKGEIDWPKITALQDFASGHRGFEVRVMTPDEILHSNPRLDFHGTK